MSETYYPKILKDIAGHNAALKTTASRVWHGNKRLDNELDEMNQKMLSMELLWTNASPTSEFAAQTISIDLSDAKLIEVHARVSVLTGWNAAYETSCVCSVGERGMIVCCPTGVACAYRAFTVAAGGVTFTGGLYNANSETDVSNGWVIPTKIIKIA